MRRRCAVTGMAVALVLAAGPAQAFVAPGCDQASAEALNNAAFRGVEREVAVVDQQITRPEALGTLSCLERAMNAQIDFFFRVPSLSDILSALEQAVCDAAESAWAESVAPLNANLHRTVDLGRFVPGAGSFGGGVNAGVRNSDGRQGSTLDPNNGSVRGNMSVPLPSVEVPTRTPAPGSAPNPSIDYGRVLQ